MNVLRFWEIVCWLFFIGHFFIADYLIIIGQLTSMMWQFYISAIFNSLTFVLGYAFHVAQTDKGRKILEKYKK